MTITAKIQNLAHFPAYGLLAFLWFTALHDTLSSTGRALVVTSTLAFAFGALLELAQIAVPGRFPSLADCLLNLTGIISFASGYLLLLRTPAKGLASDGEIDEPRSGFRNQVLS